MSAHSQSPNPNQHDDPAPVPVFFYGALGFLGLIASVIALEWLTFYWDDSEVRSRQLAPSWEVQTVKAQQAAEMTTTKWLGNDKQVVKIPIKQAMELVVKEIAANPQSASPPATQPATTSAPSPKPTSNQKP